MGWLFKKNTSAKKESDATAVPDPAAEQIRKEIEQNLEALEFLVAGPFDKDKVQSYFALCKKHGKNFDFKTILAFENADPEQLRLQTLLPTHIKAWGMFFELLSKMRPTPATAKFLMDATKRYDQIGSKLQAK
jgi:hypothetical protein